MSNNTVVRLKPSNFERLKKIDPDINIAISMLLGKDVTNSNIDKSELDYDKIKKIVKDAVEDAIQELKAGRY